MFDWITLGTPTDNHLLFTSYIGRIFSQKYTIWIW